MSKTTLDRKQLKQPDAFVTKGRSLLDSVMAHRHRFLPIAIFAVVLGAIAFGYDWWSDTRVEKAWKAYVKANSLPETSRWDALQGVVETETMSRPSFLAAVSLADHHYDLRKDRVLKKSAESPASAEEAIKWYERALSYSDLNEKEKQLLWIDVGKSYELDRKWEQAFSHYQKAADIGGDIKPYALLQIARIHELKDEKAKAEEVYKQLSSEYGDTEYARMAKNYLRLMKSPTYQPKFNKG